MRSTVGKPDGGCVARSSSRRRLHGEERGTKLIARETVR